MPSPLRCYVLRAEDGGLFCGAHPYDTREEAEIALPDFGDYGDGFKVVELVEVVRCGECRHWHANGAFCASPHVDTETPADWFCADGEK